MIARHDPPADEATRRACEAERKRVRHDDRRRNAAIRSALSELPRIELPHREYHLFAGPVTAATELRDPNEIPGAGGWQRPDLFWPDDRRWFVATDVDFRSLHISGDRAFIEEVLRAVPTHHAAASPADAFVAEN